MFVRIGGNTMVCTVLATVGVLVGIRLVVGLVRWRRHGRFGGGCGMSRFGGHHHGFGRWRGRWGGGFGQSHWLRSAFARLDTTPGQEREIKAALEELRETALAQKERKEALKNDLAEAFESDVFEDAKVLTTARQVGDSLQDAASRALRRIASALDDKQRKQVAEWLRSRRGFGPFGGGGPYRAAMSL
jgi:Spy/CpxP family protein refolding chaperone